MEMQVSCVHPSRSRPDKAFTAYSLWKSRAGMDVEYILSIDNDDPEKENYENLFGNAVTIICNDNLSCVDAINKGAEKCTGNIIIVVSDDFDCPNGWAVELLDHLEGKEDYIVKVHDGHQPVIITLSIMDRKYYERFGYIYYPEYRHQFVDTEQTAVAHLLGKVIELPMTFPHLHPAWDNSIKVDELYKRNNATWRQGERLYRSRIKSNFGLKPEEVIGRIPRQINLR